MKNKEILGMIDRCQLISNKIAERGDWLVTTLITLRVRVEEMEREATRLERELEKLRIENQQLKMDRAKIPSRARAKVVNGKSIE